MTLGAVHTALRLSACPEALDPIALVHLIPFLAGTKNCCRLMVSAATAGEVRRSIQQDGIFATAIPVETFRVGVDWQGFRESQDPLVADVMLALSRCEDTAPRLAEAELTGDHLESGRLLGYPDCCIRNYEHVAACAGNWPLYYLGRSKAVSRWCNRLTCLRGAPCPTGYLFPCSLTCPAAIDDGRRNMSAFEAFGLHRLADAIMREATTPLVLADGEVHCAGEELSGEVINIL